MFPHTQHQARQGKKDRRLNRFNPDSDNDGCPDGIEFPVARVQQPGKDPLDPTLGGSCQ